MQVNGWHMEKVFSQIDLHLLLILRQEQIRNHLQDSMMAVHAPHLLHTAK